MIHEISLRALNQLLRTKRSLPAKPTAISAGAAGSLRVRISGIALPDEGDLASRYCSRAIISNTQISRRFSRDITSS